MATKNHPDFGRAPLERRYTGKLAELPAKLRAEAYRVAAANDAPGWAWAVLPHGALVALQVTEIERCIRKRWRIARRGRPETDEQRAKWERELATFEKHLGLAEGYEAADTPDAVGAERIYTQLFPGELAPGQGRCGRCGADVRYEPMYGAEGQACNDCAFANGREYTKAREAERRLRVVK